MDPRHKNILRNLKLHNQMRFLVYLYWLRFQEWIYQFKTPRARTHWLGHANRPRRLERALGLFVICGALIFLEPREYVAWSAWWGGMASAFVIWRSFKTFIPRKQYHWMGKRPS